MWYPLLRFREEGYETFTIGPESGKVYQSKKGYPCKADKGIDSVAAEVGDCLVYLESSCECSITTHTHTYTQDLDALIIPGGFAPDYWRRDKRFLDLVKNTFTLGIGVLSHHTQVC